MTDFYTPPDSDLKEPNNDPANIENVIFRAEPKVTSIFASVAWINSGFKTLFSSSHAFWMMVVMFIVSALIYLVVSSIAGLLPVVGALIGNVVFISLIAGGYLLINQLLKTKEVKIELLFIVIAKKRYVDFILLTLIQFAISIVGLLLLIAIATVMFDISFSNLISGYLDMMVGSYTDEELTSLMENLMGTQNLLWFLLISVLVFLPLSSVMLFSPALLILNDNVTLMQSVKYGVIGYLKNLHAILVYWILASILLFVGMIPIFLGLLIVIPVLYISSMFCVKEIFLED